MKKTTKTIIQIHPGKLIFGIILLILGSVIMFSNISKSTSESYSQKDEPITIEGFSGQSEHDELPNRVIIPSVNIDLEIKLSKVVNGYWEVHADKAGWGEGSGIPGIPGNQVIFAHARDGLFGPLKNVEVGEVVYVLTKNEINTSPSADSESEILNKWYVYEITNITEVNPNDTKVIKPTDDEILTLYTCSGFKDSKRLIVVAKPSEMSIEN